MPEILDNPSSSNHLMMSFSSDDEEYSKRSSSNQNVPLSELKALDNLLRCPSCYDYIRTAMILPNCHHNFCSLCIRKYFCYKTQCPACSAQASGPELRNNRILDNIIEQYKKIKKPLKKIWREKENTTSPKDICIQEGCKSSVVAAVDSSLTNHITKNLLIADVDSEIEIWEEDTKKVATKFTDYDSDLDFHGENVRKVPAESCNCTREKFDKIFPSSSDNQKTKQTEKPEKNIFTKLKDESMLTDSDSCLPSCSTPVSSQDSSQDTSNTDKVDCPVCGVSIRQQIINKHLDNCLHKTEKIESLRSSSKKKPLTKLVYHLMSDKDIRNRLKDLGLSTDGDRKVLIKRHQEFSLLHNSDCDSLNPTATPELVKYFEKNEKLQKKLSDSSRQKGLKISKNADEEEIRQAQKSYEKQHKSQFKALIEQARNKAKSSGTGRARKTNVAPEDSEEEAEESNTDNSQQSENLAEVIRQTVDDIGRMVSNSSQESFDLFPGSEFKKPVEEEPRTPAGKTGTSSKDSNSNNLDDNSDLDEACIVKTPCRKSLFESKSMNGDASPIPQSPVIGNNMFLSPRRSKLSAAGGTLYVDDSGSEMGDSTPCKDKSCIENSVNTTGSSELWPALSLKTTEQNKNKDNGEINGDIDDIESDVNDIESDVNGGVNGDVSDTSDIIPVCELEVPPIDSIIRPTRLSLQLRQSNSVRKSERQKRKADNDGEERSSKKHKY